MILFFNVTFFHKGLTSSIQVSIRSFVIVEVGLTTHLKNRRSSFFLASSPNSSNMQGSACNIDTFRYLISYVSIIFGLNSSMKALINSFLSVQKPSSRKVLIFPQASESWLARKCRKVHTMLLCPSSNSYFPNSTDLNSSNNVSMDEFIFKHFLTSLVVCSIADSEPLWLRISQCDCAFYIDFFDSGRDFSVTNYSWRVNFIKYVLTILIELPRVISAIICIWLRWT